MNHLAFFLGQHNEYQNAVYFYGINADRNSINEIIETTAFKHLYIVFEDSFDQEKNALSLEKINQKYTIIDFIKLNRIENIESYIFVFDHFVNKGLMCSFANYNPCAVLGFFDKGIDTFEIWERYRLCCKKINLATFFNECRNEVLDWDYENDIELSVVFPMYNVQNYLEKCINTVTQWNAPYIEFLFVNDGSKDDSANVIKQYAKKDKRIKLLNKENGGCASARNFGLQNAHGRYVGFFDPDDFCDPTMYKKLLSRAIQGTYDIAYSGYYEYYENTQTTKKVDDITGEPYTFGTSDIRCIDELIAYRRVAIWRGIYRKAFLDKNNIQFYTDLKRFDDLPFKVQTLARAKYVVSIDEPLYFYRMGRPGQDVSADDERIFVHFDIFKYLDKFFEKARSSEQLDYYYMVKVTTHYWAMTILRSEFYKKYLDLASNDLGIKNTKRNWKKVLSSYYHSNEIKEFLRKF